MTKFLIFFFGLTTLTFPLPAQPPPPNGAKGLPPQATIVRGVLVPVPREIFLALDRFAHSNWLTVQRPELAHWRPPGDQVHNALLLGALIAEGFVAVEAEDTAETKDIGRAVRTLARGLGVETAALRRSRSIIDHAESGDWPAVRKEWDGVLPDVQQSMNEIRSEQLAQLVSLGGWLRGTEVLTALLSQSYSVEHVQLLRQPAVLDYFEKQLTRMSGDVRTDPIVVRIGAGIRKVRDVLASDNAPLSRKKVQEISSLSTDLLKDLNR